VSAPSIRAIDGSVTAPRGFRASGVSCGIKASGAPDLALLVSDEPCAAAGVFLSLGYLFMVHTLRYADISASATIRFSVVLWALLSGVAIFGEWPDRYAIVGILLIVGAGVYTLHREAKLRKQRAAQAAE
jgi:drug/metabolite transporter (DMT)-like permease